MTPHPHAWPHLASPARARATTRSVLALVRAAVSAAPAPVSAAALAATATSAASMATGGARSRRSSGRPISCAKFQPSSASQVG
jgi:hypothetical protein